MTETSPGQHLRACIQKVATGPEYSKDLSFEEALLAMRHILEPEADPVQAAIYLIALRMKRETDEENRGTLQALLDRADIVTAAVDEVVDVSDPYDGFVRCTPASTFVPAVLASLGVPAVLHGLDAVGPKFGATHHKVLKAAGVSTGLRCADAASQLARCGWTYVDQARFAPRLHELIPLRQRMVKRQVLTTVETLLAPVRGRRRTHYMGGYVHKAYPEIYAALARHAGFSSALFIRGVEGGIVPSLQQAGKLFFYQDGGELQPRDLLPQVLGIQAEVRAVPLPEALPEPPLLEQGLPMMVNPDALAAHAARLGLAALSGERGLTYDSLVYAASICLTHLGRQATLAQAAAAVRTVLDNGSALAAFRSVA
ncbi:MAG TPA: anthranilate phosphoribosyltransferase [Thiolinea sp.]|nr:anthranilate phosphoribosyltransferase [Thiolinea sp.]